LLKSYHSHRLTQNSPKRENMSQKHVLVTGGAGFIGSHTTLQLLKAGMRVTIVDNLCNSSLEAFERVRELSAREDAVDLVRLNLCDESALEAFFKKAYDTKNGFDACIHFAALKAVGESVKMPLKYYTNNLTGTLNLLEAMSKYGCKTIVFSSSATVYGSSKSPLSEESMIGVGVTNPYGQTKFMMEQILRDLQKSDPKWKVVLLRYFNPVGAHASGRIGEDPKGIPNNLMPYVQQVAVGRRPHLNVFGDDYDTVDGTGVRDYIHVVDLAEGHLKALSWAFSATSDKGGFCDVFNLGTGSGSSVLQVVKSMEKACGHKVPYKIAPRRAGDLATVFANPQKARKVLGWNATRNMDVMCADSWRWQSHNPVGFGGSSPSAKTWIGIVRMSFATMSNSETPGAAMLRTLQKYLLSKVSLSISDAHAKQFLSDVDAFEGSWPRGPCVKLVDALVKEQGVALAALQSAEAKCRETLIKDASTTQDGKLMFDAWVAQRQRAAANL